jgi:glycosyltransferase involved in cell wall biosynthesis
LPKRISDSWKQRQRLYEAQPNLVAVSPSRWLAEEAKAGLWAGHRIEVIPNGLRLDVYRPLDRLLARQALGIDTPGPVLMFAAHGLLERRKGLDLMIAALPHLSHRPLTLLILGSGRCPIRAEGVHVHSLGYVDHERTKVLAYNAADVFVHPAIADNLPNTVMESLACATPVVAFPIGGVPDMVRPGLTGWLASEVSPMALANVLADALTKTGSGVDLRGPCRAAAEVEFSEALQAQRYLSVFRSLGGRDSES